jgi:iron complex outermembrane receptor protein
MGRANHIATAGSVVLGFSFTQMAFSQSAPPVQPQSNPPSAQVPLPPLNVEAKKPSPKKKSTGLDKRATKGAATAPAQTPVATAGVGASTNWSLQQAPALGKTGTKLEDLPQSVVIVPGTLVTEQGGTSVRSAIRDVSSVNEGGSSSYGFFDRFLIRGMDARVYSDSFPDGDQSNGFPHSLNGVERIEVLKGPGSALFGSTTPGGSINIVHFEPSSTFSYGAGLQVGSFGTISNTFYATGPTTLPGLNYRIDGLIAHSDGFRDLESANYEVRPVISWNANDHHTTLAFDFRHIERTPDSYGLIYFNGTPINMPRDTKYSTPFSQGDQDIQRVTLADAWTVSDFLTINNRISFLHRDLDILRNSGGTVTGTSLTNRQLREQSDHDDDFVYQFEPVWKFKTGTVGHTLLTGLQVEWQQIDDNRATASLAPIANIFAPVIPETSTAGLTFLRDAAHSGMVDTLHATYLGAYATDQIDVTDQFKLRLSGRQDWWYEDLTPQVFVPGRINTDTGQLFQPGVTQSRVDTPFSWSVGGLYKILPGLAPFAGVSRSFLTNFNSESTQSGVVAPESGLQYEAGVKITAGGGRIVLTTAAFDIQRTNVFNENTVTGAVTFNAQRTRGVDADLQVQVTPKWKITANAVAQEAVLTEVPSAPTQVGNRPVGAPAHIYNVWTTYDFAIGNLDGFKAGAGLSYTDKTFGNTANTVWIPSAEVVDAMFGYFQPKWDMQVGVKNIADVTYFTTALSAGGYVGEPRTFYAKAGWHF